ncbi:MAG: GtrA family protein [Bacteroidales bacterium]|jgi:putative flippase GtrA|nr:GtrA family protein [Bacteroidales bacterium]
MPSIISFCKSLLLRIRGIILCVIPPFLLKYPIVKRFLGFSFVGVVVTAVGIFQIFFLLKILPRIFTDLQGFPAWLYIANTFSTLFSILQSYYLNSRLVFKSGKSQRNLLIYYAIYGISLLINLGTLRIYDLYLPINDPLVLSLLAIPVTMAWNFFVSSRFLKPVEKNAVFDEENITL